MKKTTINIVLALLCLNFSSHAQNDIPLRPLKIGDKVPNITIDNIINYKTPTARISDFKGKLLILDFWATWCSPCVAMIPKMDSLQKQFQQDIQFLPIAYQSNKEIQTFFTRTKTKHRVSGLQVTGDTMLSLLFPHTYLPHYVWINSNGIVIAITGYEAVTSKNISAALNTQNLSVQLKRDSSMKFDMYKPLLSGNNGNPDYLIYHSLMTTYQEGLVSGYTLFPPDTIKGRRILSTNESPLHLFSLAYMDQGYLGNNRILLEVKDTTRFKTKLKGTAIHAWRQQNAFCYELIVPFKKSGQIFSIMQHDLDKYFDQYSARMVPRITKCLVLKRTSSSDKLKTAGGNPVVKVDALGCSLRNTYLNQFINPLNLVYLQLNPMPVIDGTGYLDKVDLNIEANLSSVAEINQQLSKYDLKLVEEKRKVNMLVISDRFDINDKIYQP